MRRRPAIASSSKRGKPPASDGTSSSAKPFWSALTAAVAAISIRKPSREACPEIENGIDENRPIVPMPVLRNRRAWTLGV